jgi:NAD(P)-dependent dehydrogenase (short-subunit alcohol dehydrogenase family)
MKNLRDKIVVITGAGSGIGRATAHAFARHGARVHLVDVDRARVEQVEAELRALGPSVRAVVAHVVDCADGAAVVELAHGIFETEGRVDVLHNNAGVCLGGPVDRIAIDDWKWIIDVNLWGVVHGIHAFLPGMIAQGGGGHIVNTASMAGLVGLPMVVPYCTTKFAVVGLSEALSSEVGVHGIHVTTVCPASVRTGIFRSARIDLPGPWLGRLSAALDRYALRPEKLAEQIVEAVRCERSMVIRAGELLPLWLLKRTSIGLYNRITRELVARALRMGKRQQRAPS